MDEAYHEWLDYCIEVGIPEHEVTQTVVNRAALCRTQGAYRQAAPAPSPAARPAPRRGLWRMLEIIFGKAAALLTAAILLAPSPTAVCAADEGTSTMADIEGRYEIDAVDQEILSTVEPAPALVGSDSIQTSFEPVEQQLSTMPPVETPEYEDDSGVGPTLFLGALFGAVAFAVFALMWWRIETRLIRLHRAFLSFADSGIDASARIMGLNVLAGHHTPASPVRLVISSQQQVLADLARTASRLGAFRLLRPIKPWSLGLSSSTGPVRERNEDYGCAFRLVGLADVDVVGIGDGLGGSKYGAEAASVAVPAGCEAVIRRLSAGIRCDSRDLLAAVEQGFEAAISAVRRTAESSGLNDDGCFQTTLILVVASKGHVAWGYIGDGLGVVLDSDGGTRRWLVPHKADPSRPNILSACLGPRLLGSPRTGCFERSKGGLILVGTDGIADFVNSDFPQEVSQCALERGGDLQSTSQAVIEMMAAQVDAEGPVCSDNMTIALIGTGHAPSVCKAREFLLETTQ